MTIKFGWKEVSMRHVLNDMLQFIIANQNHVESVWIISPYVTLKDRDNSGLLNFSRRAAQILHPRPRPADFISPIKVVASAHAKDAGIQINDKGEKSLSKSKSCDVELLKQIQNLHIDVRLRCSLHSKLYAVRLQGEESGIIWHGSSNISEKSWYNHELLTKTDVFPNEISDKLNILLEDDECKSKYPCDCENDLDIMLNNLISLRNNYQRAHPHILRPGVVR